MSESVSRRTFLRASGIAVSLPLLESSFPSLARAEDVAQPRRMVNICNSLGFFPESWFPKEAGASYEATEYLKLLDRHRASYTLFSGLSHEEQTGRQPHNSEVTWLTAARGPGRDGFKNSISLDQAAADHLGYVTRFPSVVLGSATAQSQSYTTSGVMVPAQTSPSKLFAKMFLAGHPDDIAREKRNLRSGGSILDGLGAQTALLKQRVSRADRDSLDAYYEAVRATERDLVEAGAWQDRPKPVVDVEPPTDSPSRADLIGRVRLWFRMIPLILETDSSRVVSVMIQDHLVVPQVEGVSADHHNLSHHGQDPSKIAQLKKIERLIVGSFGDLLDELARDRGPQGTLLDTTSVLFGSNLGNANSHLPKDLPILVAGGGFAHGRHVVHEGPQNAPLSNLYVSLLQTMGVETDRFGQSDGVMSLG